MNRHSYRLEIPRLIHCRMSAILSGVPSHHGFILSNTICAFNKYAQGVSTLRACEENGVSIYASIS